MAAVEREFPRKAYPGNNVSEIARLIGIAVEHLEKTYLNGKATFYFSAEKSKLTRAWIIKKAAKQVAKDFPNTDGLTLVEAMNNMIEGLK